MENLRSKIVTNKHIFKSASQYLNRIGLFCTADKPATSITEYQIVRRPDIQARNGDLVTDGCGLFINLSLYICNQVVLTNCTEQGAGTKQAAMAL